MALTAGRQNVVRYDTLAYMAAAARSAYHLAQALRQAVDAAALTQERIAEATGVHQTAVSKWLLGKATPPLDALPLLDELCGEPRGHILRLAGYVADELDVIAAISTDPTIDEDSREFLLHAYRFCQNVAAEAPELLTEPTDAELASIVPDLNDVEGEAKIWKMRRLTDAQKRREVWLLRQRRAEKARQDRPKVKRQTRQAG